VNEKLSNDDIDLDQNLAKRKKDLNNFFLHFSKSEDLRYNAYFILLLAINVEGFTNCCITKISAIKNINQIQIGEKYVKAFRVLNFFGSFSAQEIPYEARGFERPDLKLAYEMLGFMQQDQFENQNFKLKKFDFRIKQWDKLLALYSIDDELEEQGIKEEIKIILDKRNKLAHGEVNDIEIDSGSLQKYLNTTLKYLDLIKKNTKELLDYIFVESNNI